MLGALNAYEKDLLREYHYRLFKCFESAQRSTDAELGEQHTRDFGSEIYILSLTMETIVALK